LAFGSGGFNSAMQLGVSHALLVARGVAPDYVAGLSAGAVTAAALAEILQSGEGLSDPERRNAQIDNFRKFLASFQELPGELLRSILPDTYEINASLPLEPIELPIHFDAERRGRDDANQTRAGLIRVLNRLLEVRLPVSAIAVIVNRTLHFIAAAEEVSRAKRIRRRLKNAGHLWLLGYRFLFGVAPTLRSLAWAATSGAPREDTKRKAGRPAGKLIGRVRAARQWVWDALTVFLFIPTWLLVAPIALCLLLWLYFRRPTRKRRGWGRLALDRILEHYSIADGLGSTYVLKQQLIRCFDTDYHGKPDIATILDKALSHSKEPAQAEDPQKTLAAYQTRHPQIVVAPIAAEVGSGDLKVLPHDVPVVDALLAATAAVPIFPAVKIESWAYKKDGVSEKVFIDGRHVSAEPVGALLEFLRDDKRLDEAVAVDIYPVSNLALDVNGSTPRRELSGILAVAERAYELQRYRDATIDQRLTQLYTKALPAQGGARVTLGERSFVRAEMRAVGLERPIGIDREIFRGGSRQGLKELVHDAVADGCRAALEAMIPGAIAEAAGKDSSVPCERVIGRRLGALYASPRLLGSREGPPGLPEICDRCALVRTSTGQPEEPTKQHLKVLPNRQDWPEWPIEGQPPAPMPTPISRPRCQVTVNLPGWPRERAGLQGSTRPLVNFLFGGGVFRGVFHMGVMNALNEMGLEPDLVAGSSVGSIIAAMIAQAFNEPADQRPNQIANLAATFLSIDQLVMTDRLADFFRGLTLRAADAPFSPRDLDLVLRRYDVDWSGGWSSRVRRVVGGFERFFYLSPVRLAALVKAGRERDIAQLSVLLQEAVQEFLDRSGVGQEILGTEPLALLIQHEVIRRLDWSVSDKLFDAFQGRGIHFLATATNLSQGRLEILGSPESQPDVSLLYGLLASSAFPGVFRPRESWEIFRNAMDRDRYIDGGTIDNLPLDAVARFLDLASQAQSPLVARRPKADGHEVPHLLFTASLEVDKTSLPDRDVETIRRSFLRLRSRARTLSYNRKIDAYASVQRNLRDIYNRRKPTDGGADGATPWQPLDLHVIAVRPRWLCSTFGFHPMLGFRRYRQAQSIAHGCASTIATLYDQSRKEGGRTWTEAWGIRGLDAVDSKAVTSRIDPSRQGLNPQREGKPAGQCWFRNALCPFSSQALALRADLVGRQPLVRELAKVYEVCGKPETHRPAHSVQDIVE
jgi:predicted acylesterase/phospholipase RssA